MGLIKWFKNLFGLNEPNYWKPEEDDLTHIGGYTSFIYGIKKGEHQNDGSANFYTDNDFELTYNRKTTTFSIWFRDEFNSNQERKERLQEYSDILKEYVWDFFNGNPQYQTFPNFGKELKDSFDGINIFTSTQSYILWTKFSNYARMNSWDQPKCEIPAKVPRNMEDAEKMDKKWRFNIRCTKCNQVVARHSKKDAYKPGYLPGFVCDCGNSSIYIEETPPPWYKG